MSWKFWNAEKVEGSEFSKEQAPIAAKAQGGKAAAMTPTDIANHLLSDGLDHKGQFSMGSVGSGYGIGFDASFDPAKIVLCTAKVGVNAKVTRMSHTMLTAEVLPSSIGGTATHAMALACLTGVEWGGKLGVDASVGIGLEANVDLGVKKKSGPDNDSLRRGESKAAAGGQGEASASFVINEKKGTAAKDDSPDDPVTLQLAQMERIGAELSLFAGFKASVSGEYNHAYLSDAEPAFYPSARDDRAQLRKQLGAIVAAGSSQEERIRAAVDFINSASVYFDLTKAEATQDGSMLFRYDKWFRTHTADAKNVVEVLKSGLPKLEARAAQFGGRSIHALNLATTRKLIERLGGGVTSELKTWHQMAPMCFVSLSSMKGAASAGVGVEAKAGAHLGHVATAEVQAELELLGAGYNGKGAWIRHQTPIEPTGAGQTFYCTRDTKIVYHKVAVRALTGSLGGSVRVVHKSAKGKVETAHEHAFLNRLSYLSSVVYWQAPRPTLQRSGPQSPGKRVSTKSVDALGGTGLVVGQSVEAKLLRKMIATPSSAAVAELAKALRISTEKLRGFFQALHRDAWEETVDSLIQKDTVSGLLLEATFGVKPTDLLLTTEVDVDKKGVATTQHVLDGDARTKMLTTFLAATEQARSNSLLQSIRLRYRIADKRDQRSEGFRIGIPQNSVADFGITIAMPKEATAEGIVDLCTEWQNGFDKSLGALAVYEREDAVPGAVLFCQ